jgi:hypothetical protein
VTWSHHAIALLQDDTIISERAEIAKACSGQVNANILLVDQQPQHKKVRTNTKVEILPPNESIYTDIISVGARPSDELRDVKGE